MSIEKLIEQWSAPPPPAGEVITLGRRMAERALDWLEQHPKIETPGLSEEVCALREALAEPKVELWAIHSVGPGEIYPSLSREHAEQEAKALIESCRKAIGTEVVVNVIPSPWEPAEHFEILAEEVTKHRDELLDYVKELQAKEAKP